MRYSLRSCSSSSFPSSAWERIVRSSASVVLRSRKLRSESVRSGASNRAFPSGAWERGAGRTKMPAPLSSFLYSLLSTLYSLLSTLYSLLSTLHPRQFSAAQARCDLVDDARDGQPPLLERIAVADRDGLVLHRLAIDSD